MHVKHPWMTGFFINGLFTLCTSTAVAGSDNMLVYIGTYTGGGSKGIYTYRLDTSTGVLSAISLTEGITNPSFLAIHPNRRFLYAVAEVGDYGGKNSGGVSAFAVDHTTGKLRLLNRQSSEGAGPCHLIVDRQGK